MSCPGPLLRRIWDTIYEVAEIVASVVRMCGEDAFPCWVNSVIVYARLHVTQNTASEVRPQVLCNPTISEV